MLNRCWSHCRSPGQPSFVVGMLVSEGGAFMKDLLKNVRGRKVVWMTEMGLKLGQVVAATVVNYWSGAIQRVI